MTFDAVVFVLTLWLGSHSLLDVFIHDGVLYFRCILCHFLQNSLWDIIDVHTWIRLMTCVNAANITIFLVCNMVCPLWSRFDLPVYQYGLLPHIMTVYPQLWFLA
ncbi:hypothetical protein EDC04DRAFT_2750851 [Pisolithus marmoratus]|nr:hypothetical protein EDC04DRAFT_2750851 [Pisolithus marmoratus]